MSLSQTLRSLCEFDTALIANVIGYIADTPPHQYYMDGTIQSLTPDLGPTAGVAVTCEIDTSSPDNVQDMDDFWEQADEIHRMDEPVIWVAKTVGSRPDHECVIGDGMGKILHAAGCIGVVTDGGARDISGFNSTPIAIHCKGTVIHHTPIRVQSINQPVQIGGIEIKPGDVIHSDREGVIKVPPSCLPQLTDSAIKMRAFEYEVHCELRRNDLSPTQKQKLIPEILKKYGFHSNTKPTNTTTKPSSPASVSS